MFDRGTSPSTQQLCFGVTGDYTLCNTQRMFLWQILHQTWMMDAESDEIRQIDFTMHDTCVFFHLWTRNSYRFK